MMEVLASSEHLHVPEVPATVPDWLLCSWLVQGPDSPLSRDDHARRYHRRH